MRLDPKTGFCYYLRVLLIRDGVTHKYLNDMTSVTENTTVSMISSMIQKGLVKATRNTVDSPKIRVTLTNQGRALQSDLMQYAIDINRTAVAGIDPAEIVTCIRMLTQMSVNLAAEFDKVLNASDKSR